MIPHYLAIGVTKYEFFHSTLIGLRDYDEAYRLRRKLEDEKAFFMGVYAYKAVSTALENAFRKKGTKPSPYFEEPILVSARKREEERKHLENLTEEEKRKYTDDLFAMLGNMQANFERTHGGE